MSESDLQSDIITALCLDTRVAWAMAVTTGKFKVKGGYITTGHYVTDDLKRKVGISDVIGQLRDGRLLAIEVKQPGEQPTAEQVEFMGMVISNGGVSGWATTVKEVYAILDGEVEDGKV